MHKLNISFDYDYDGIVWDHPTYSYSPKEETVYTADGWKIWAKDEQSARAAIIEDIRSTWSTEYNAWYTKTYGDTV